MNDLSLTRDEQEIEFLRLQVLEQQHVIDDLSLVCLRLHQCQALLGVPGDMGLQNSIRGVGNVGRSGEGERLTELLLVMGPSCSILPESSLHLLYTTSPGIWERFPWLLFLLSPYAEFAAIKKQHQPLLKRVSGLYRVGVIDLSWISLMVFF